MKAEDPGQMRHRVKFLMPLEGRDTMGGEIHTWLTSNEVWARVQFTLSGSGEQEMAERVMSMLKMEVTMRFRDGIYPKMRLVYDGREFNILAIAESHRRQYMTLECVEDEVTRDKYWSGTDGEFWEDPDGSSWVAFTGTGGVAESYRTVGGLTWTDPDGNTWTQT